jgi:hypothetical protein
MTSPAPRPTRRGLSPLVLAAVALVLLALAGVYWLTRPVGDATGLGEKGPPAGAVVDLSDAQMRSIRETGKLRVRFEDGRVIEVDVPR